MNDLSCVDAEYFICKDGYTNDSLIIGVKSKALNANCSLRIDDKYLSESTCGSIMKTLKGMESNLVYQSKNGLIRKSPCGDKINKTND